MSAAQSGDFAQVAWGAERHLRPVWRRCVCDQYGRCLVDCPSADLPRPNPSAYYDRRRGEWVQR